VSSIYIVSILINKGFQPPHPMFFRAPDTCIFGLAFYDIIETIGQQAGPPDYKGGSTMKHAHKYESFSHHGISSELMELGIEAAETRKCGKCGKEMPFLLTRKSGWIQLFRESESDEKDILLA
jgi:hypothetical protein